MAKFQLQENETLIGSGMMAYKHKKSPASQPTRGTIYVTNQRVCYYESWSNYVYMDLPLSEVAGYDTKRALFVTFVYIYDRPVWVKPSPRSIESCLWIHIRCRLP